MEDSKSVLISQQISCKAQSNISQDKTSYFSRDTVPNYIIIS